MPPRKRNRGNAADAAGGADGGPEDASAAGPPPTGVGAAPAPVPAAIPVPASEGKGNRLLTYVKTIQTRSNIVRCFQRIAFYLTREVSPPDPNHSDVPRATGRM